jgi:tRNA threonylcarbamoyl adenosine modification protein YeaZ
LNLVAIDTSTRFAGVGVLKSGDDGEIRTKSSWRSNQNHGRELMPAIVESLRELEMEPKDLTHVAVALGPGGFSAVRVGISAALGLVVSKQLPVLGIPTHEIEAHPYMAEVTETAPLYSLIPAGRNEISWSRSAPSHKADIGVLAPENLVFQLESGAILCGEACDLMAGLVDPSRLRGGDSFTRDPDVILDIAVKKFELGVTTPYEELRPIYARPPSISKPKPPK